jgi:hypothetical protein
VKRKISETIDPVRALTIIVGLTVAGISAANFYHIDGCYAAASPLGTIVVVSLGLAVTSIGLLRPLLRPRDAVRLAIVIGAIAFASVAVATVIVVAISFKVAGFHCLV